MLRSKFQVKVKVRVIERFPLVEISVLAGVKDIG